MTTTKLNHENLLEERIDIIKTYLDRLEPFGFSGTVLIALKDTVLLEKGYGYMDYERKTPMKSEAVLSLGSIAKQFTSTLILRLQERGLLSVTDKLSKFLTKVPQDKQDITIHQLLTHTSGLVNGLGEDFEQIDDISFLNQVFQSNLVSLPGTEFHYSNVGFSVAAIIAERVSGVKYQRLLRQLFADLGIKSASWFGDPMYKQDNSVSYYVEGEKKGSVYDWPGSWNEEKSYWHILGNGGVTISNQDMFTYMKALFKGEIIGDSLVGKMLTPELNNYGYGWEITETPMGVAIGHDGGSDGGVSSIAGYIPDHELTVLISSNTILNGFGMAFQVRDKVLAILMGQALNPPEVHPVGNIEVGKFGIAEMLDCKVILEKNDCEQLVLHLQGQKILDMVLNHDQKKRNAYSYMNEITDQFGVAYLNEQWEEAFKLTKKKDGNEQRIGFLIELKKHFESKFGKLVAIKSGGTLAYPNYLAMSHLQMIGEDGSSGIPLIWENPQEILGFRPLLSNYPLSCVAQVENDIVIGYSISQDKSFKFKIENDLVKIVE